MRTVILMVTSGLGPLPLLRQIREIIQHLRELASPEYDVHDADAIQIRAAALISRLKTLNRSANLATRTRKDATAVARQEMDQSYLGLQNLLYEKRHLEREIEKCRQFASVYQDVPLHSLEDFQRLAPEEARNDSVMENEHQLMLNRLSFELAERQRLDLKRKELIQAKEEMIKESKTKAATMENVKAQIDTLVKTATEIQKKVEELVQPVSTADSITSS